jgi:hypothetical protein
VDVLPLLVQDLLDDGVPLDRYYGRVLSKRAAKQAIRRAAVGVILDGAPPEYQRPRGKGTFDYVAEQLQKLSPLLAEQYPASYDTLQKDIEDWAYNPETGRRRRRTQSKANRPPHEKAAAKSAKTLGKTMANAVKPGKPPRRKT